jgi:type II secretory pathway component PulC
MVVVALGGCGAPAPGAAPAAHGEVESCQRERQALEQRLAAAEQRIEELESESAAVTPVSADADGGTAEEIRIQFPRDKFDALFSDQAALMKSARAVPASRDGQVTGIRLFGMRPGTALTQLGFQNGDELRSVNGYELTSPEKTLEAYAAVRKASELRIEMIRRGRPLRLVLEIVDPPTR